MDKKLMYPKKVISQLGAVDYYDKFIKDAAANKLFNTLKDTIDWLQFPITIFGKTYLQPRLIAFEGDPNIHYTYSKTRLKANKWSPEILQIKQACEQQTKNLYNCVLINYYRDGNDSMGWHSDDEKELGKYPSIASVSIGAERLIHFRLRNKHQDKTKILLKMVACYICWGLPKKTGNIR